MDDRSSLDSMGALDLDRAVAIHGDSFRASGERAWSRRDFAGLLASPGVAGLILVEADTDIGLVLCRTVADEAELLTLAVRSGHRRSGAGRHLLRAAIEGARRAGARSLFLEVGADNVAARKLYEAAAFRAVGFRPAYYPRRQRPAADAIVMRLELD